jgi:HK97 family phage portal protein
MSFKTFYQKRASRVTGDYYIRDGQANPTEHNLQAITKEGYEQNAYVYACVDLISNTAASLKPVLYDVANHDKKKIDDNDLNDLLMHPNDDQGRFAFFKESFSYYLLHGKFPIQNLRTNNNQAPRMLYNLEPKTVDVVSGGPTNPIKEFKVRAKGGEITLPKRNVIYVKDFSPKNITDGHPTAFSAGLAIDANNAMMKWNLRNMQNGGVPPVAIYGARSDKQVSDLRDGWRRNYGGFENAGEPFFPKGDVEIKPIGMNTKDAQWIEGIQLTGQLIMMAFSVPFDVLFGASNRASYEQAYKSLYIQAVLPLWQAFLDAYNTQLVPDFTKKGQHLMLEIDKDSIDALSEDKNEKHKRVRQDYLAGLTTRAESRDAIQFNPDESGADGDAFQRPVNVVVVDQDGEDEPMAGQMEDITPAGNNQTDAEPNADDESIADR